MFLSLKESDLRLRNSTTRIPFRYGTACLTRCPQATMRVVIELRGRVQTGYSGDCLPPSWFDKNPEKTYATQIEDMLRVIDYSQSVFNGQFATQSEFFPGWLIAHERIQEQCRAWQLPPLLASFGSSLMERAILDAACRRFCVSFAQGIRSNLFGIRPTLIHEALAGFEPVDWLPKTPLRSVYVRQTVGLSDPLTLDDVPVAERLSDGWPQTIEEYAVRRGVNYFKVKVSNQHEHDLDRLTRLAHLWEKHFGPNYYLTLDGNEQYKRPEEFLELVEAIQTKPELKTLWTNVLVIEQPFDRKNALNAEQMGNVGEMARTKPVIIDESDGTLRSFDDAVELGYRGVSSKNCKGALKSILNAGLIWLANDQGRHNRYLMTGEDLCSVGIIPTQADLCLAATLGLDHIERNGHHYHPGLSYLPEAQRRAALAFHGDLYQEEQGIVGPRIVDGRLRLGSLQCLGFGFAVEPDMDCMEPAASWRYESLGLGSDL